MRISVLKGQALTAAAEGWVRLELQSGRAPTRIQAQSPAASALGEPRRQSSPGSQKAAALTPGLSSVTQLFPPTNRPI